MLWPFSERARKQWDEWNIRVVVLISLFLQIVLIAFANSRRKRSNTALTAAIWSFYLLADWIAAFAVGLISSGQTNDCPETTAVNRQLAAFWAPFLLLHLGGPDAITAFSLEDNELWIRHLLGLLVQVAVVLYAFLQSLQNDYWIPTVLMFFAGACKYAERTISLYGACLGNFKKSLLSKPDPGPNYAQLMAEYSALEASGVPVEIKVENEPPLNGSDVDLAKEEENKPGNGSDPSLTRIRKGYQLFNTFKGLIVDHMFSFHERDDSRKFFTGTKADEAFQVMEVELSFMYDVLYTKMAVVHTKVGYFCRLLCLALIATCFWQFACHPHHNERHFDIIVSYVLLAGAAVLEVVGLFKLVLSDWVIVSVREEVARFLMRLRFGRRDKRWSNIMFQHSFISFSLMKHHCKWLNKIAKCIKLESILIEIQYKKKKKCLENLKEFVFTELAAKAKKATTTETTKEMYSARGAHILDDYYSTQYFHPSIWASLSDEVEYDESLLLWHIATELCYFTGTDRDNECEACKSLRTDRRYNVSEAFKCLRTDRRYNVSEAFKFLRIDRCYNKREECKCTEPYNDRKVCKLLSDYMLYLLVMQPTLMSSVSGIAQVRFQDTCAEAKKFFKGLQWEDDDRRKEACTKLLGVNTAAKPKEVKGDRSKSLLFDACILANHLNNVRDKWKIMSRVWVELMSYAASRCRGADHARQLAQGGEFITFVWLLMVHFRLGEQFRIHAERERPKLVVGR